MALKMHSLTEMVSLLCIYFAVFFAKPTGSTVFSTFLIKPKRGCDCQGVRISLVI